MKQLRKFLNLTNSDRYLQIITFTLLGLVKFGLKLLPFETLQRILVTISNTNSLGLQQSYTIDQIVEAVVRSSRYIPGGALCLPRALTTQVLMYWYDYSCELRIGVTRAKKGQFETHAWVESQGQVIIGDLTNFSRFIPLPIPQSVCGK